MRIASLHTYPVKGCHRIDHDEARVGRRGLANDRRWIVIDPDGVGYTQRRHAVLSQVRIETTADGLIARAPGRADLRVSEPVDGPKQEVRVFAHREPERARLADDGGWFADVLGLPARLVWQAEGRPLDGDDRVSFADGYPILVTTEGSLSALNDWLAEAGDDPVPMTRFRPNVVVAGAEPWAEDAWLGRRLLLGDLPVRAVQPCGRCLVTTIDQETGIKGTQPLKMLGQRRRLDGKLVFGMNLIPDRRGSLRVGDTVTLAS